MNEDIDRFTITLLKMVHGKVDIPTVLKFLEVNQKMWELEEKISQTEDLREVGRLYLELRGLTKERARLKNEEKTY